MTQSEQIKLLGDLDNDIATHKVLYSNFQSFVSASPISGSRETEIVEDYLELAQNLDDLYEEVIKACAEWITEQP